ncbi:hypothetical protein OQ968_24100 [Mycobacterium sp. 663a-19]|uniref:hypothetical protein n=1 Tax=Mycobacterium sp. 663a-19 TaxID=2986148 RepID=UPI002D1F0F01|nr:hypothetical protein [Mycobacterium sp. 663a-19]MEB3984332.1 hypothetical protein [Mycobacterium sp. 663a-19]
MTPAGLQAVAARMIAASHQCFFAAVGKIAVRLTHTNMSVVLPQPHNRKSVSVRIFEASKTCLTLGK